MARALQASDLVSIRIWTKYLSQACVNTFDYAINPGSFVPGVTDLALVEAIDGLAAPLYKAIMSNVANYQGSQLTYLNVTPLPATQFYAGNNGIGVAGATAMPTQVRGISKRQTAFAGRKYRGRVYWPFPTTVSDLATGQPTAGYGIAVAAITTAIALPTGVTVTSGGGSVTIDPIIWHRKTHSFDYVTGYVTVQQWATQRKSGFYGRANTSPV